MKIYSESEEKWNYRMDLFINALKAQYAFKARKKLLGNSITKGVTED